MLKKIRTGVFIGLLFLFSFTALDDITTGNEPDFVAEYMVLAGSGLLIAYSLSLKHEKKSGGKDYPGEGKGLKLA